MFLRNTGGQPGLKPPCREVCQTTRRATARNSANVKNPIKHRCVMASEKTGRMTLTEIAAVAGINPYHFARQFKAATGLPPHQYVITRRVERAKHLLSAGNDSPMAEVAAQAGFYDQSQFCHHFKRLVGVTPSQFRTPSRIA